MPSPPPKSGCGFDDERLNDFRTDQEIHNSPFHVSLVRCYRRGSIALRRRRALRHSPMQQANSDTVRPAGYARSADDLLHAETPTPVLWTGQSSSRPGTPIATGNGEPSVRHAEQDSTRRKKERVESVFGLRRLERVALNSTPLRIEREFECVANVTNGFAVK